MEAILGFQTKLKRRVKSVSAPQPEIVYQVAGVPLIYLTLIKPHTLLVMVKARIRINQGMKIRWLELTIRDSFTS